MDVLDAAAWLVFAPAIDLANTVLEDRSGRTELLVDEDQLRQWIEIESGRVPGLGALPGRLPDVRELRDHVHAYLHARVRGEPPTPASVAALNRASSLAPTVTRTDAAFAVTTEHVGADEWSVFCAVVAGSAMEVASTTTGLAECRAPRCGFLFIADDPRQRWCSHGCGNRARVARHAERRRAVRG